MPAPELEPTPADSTHIGIPSLPEVDSPIAFNTPQPIEGAKLDVIESQTMHEDLHEPNWQTKANPGVTIVSAQNQLKVSSLFATEMGNRKREIYFTDHVSPHVVQITVPLECDDIDLTSGIGWQTSNDKFLGLYDVFQPDATLSAIIVENVEHDEQADQTLLRRLKNQGIQNVVIIPATAKHHSIQYAPFSTTYDAYNGGHGFGNLNIFNWFEKTRISVKIRKDAPPGSTESPYSAYMKYIDAGGIIPYPQVLQAENLTSREIYNMRPIKDYYNISQTEAEEKKLRAIYREIYQKQSQETELRKDLYYESAMLHARQRAEYTENTFGFKMTGRQYRLFINFRMMPEGNTHSYGYGWNRPDTNGNRTGINFQPAGNLANQVLLYEVTKLTGDNERGKLVSEWFEQHLPINDSDIPIFTRQQFNSLLKNGQIPPGPFKITDTDTYTSHQITQLQRRGLKPSESIAIVDNDKKPIPINRKTPPKESVMLFQEAVKK